MLGQVAALADGLAPGRVRRTKAPDGWARLEIVGRGKRRLPGCRPDERPHVVTLAYDGAFLQLAFRVDGRLADSRLLSLPTTADLRAVEEFLRKALARVRFDAARAPHARGRGRSTRSPPRRTR
jgi:hypothetical protein